MIFPVSVFCTLHIQESLIFIKPNILSCDSHKFFHLFDFHRATSYFPDSSGNRSTPCLYLFYTASIRWKVNTFFNSNNIIIYHTLQYAKEKEPGSPTLFSTNYDFYPFTAPTTRLSCTCLLKKK